MVEVLPFFKLLIDSKQKRIKRNECLALTNTLFLFYAMVMGALNKSYAMSVWITAILLAPIILFLVLAFKTSVEWNFGFISLYIFTVFAEVLFSLPAIFLHRLAFLELATVFKSQLVLKALLVIISFLCLGATFFLFKLAVDLTLDYETAVPLLCFGTAVIISHFIFSIRTKTASPETDTL